MPVEYRGHITRRMAKNEPDVLFVFGDNMVRRGYGGLAKQLRGEKNSVGIPTKRFPSMEENAFFTDKDFAEWFAASRFMFHRLLDHLRKGGIVVWPSADIGTHLAQLATRAPKIRKKIDEMRVFYETVYGKQ